MAASNHLLSASTIIIAEIDEVKFGISKVDSLVRDV